MWEKYPFSLKVIGIPSTWKDPSVTECKASRVGGISIAKALWDFPLPLEDRLHEQTFAAFSPPSLTNLN